MGAAPSRPPFPTSGRRKRFSRKEIVAGTVGLVLLLALCVAGFVVSADGSGSAPASPPAGQATHPPAVAPPATTPGPARTGATAGTGGSLVPVPDLVGLNASVARQRLIAAGLGNVRLVSGDPRYHIVVIPEHWSVTAQSVAAGTRVARSTVVVLTCVKPA